jgi:hypothetical protein
MTKVRVVEDEQAVEKPIPDSQEQINFTVKLVENRTRVDFALIIIENFQHVLGHHGIFCQRVADIVQKESLMRLHFFNRE